MLVNMGLGLPSLQVWVLDALPGEVRSGDMGGADRPADLISTLQNVRNCCMPLRTVAWPLSPWHCACGHAASLGGAGFARHKTPQNTRWATILSCRSRCRCQAATGSQASSRQQVSHGRYAARLECDGSTWDGRCTGARLAVYQHVLPTFFRWPSGQQPTWHRCRAAAMEALAGDLTCPG